MRAPVPAALPTPRDLVERAVGDEAEDHRVFRIDVAAEGAGQLDAVDMVDAELVHQQARAGVERRLGELDGAHVGLQDADLGLPRAGSAPQDVGEGAPGRHDAVAARGERAVDHAVLVDDAGEEHLADRLDDAGAADAGDADVAAVVAKAGSSDQRSPPITLSAARASPGRCARARWRRVRRAGRRRSRRPRRPGRSARRRRRSRSRLPSTISALVPTSTRSVISSPRCGPSASVAPAASAPTWPAMQGSM